MESSLDNWIFNLLLFFESILIGKGKLKYLRKTKKTYETSSTNIFASFSFTQ